MLVELLEAFEKIVFVLLLIDVLLEVKAQAKVVVTIAWIKVVTVELYDWMEVTVFSKAETFFSSVAVIVSLIVVVEGEAEQRTLVELGNRELLDDFDAM